MCVAYLERSGDLLLAHVGGVNAQLPEVILAQLVQVNLLLTVLKASRKHHKLLEITSVTTARRQWLSWSRATRYLQLDLAVSAGLEVALDADRTSAARHALLFLPLLAVVA